MDNCTDIKPVMAAIKDMGASGVMAEDEGGRQDVLDDSILFCRERQLILLTALFKLYGVEWEESPNWTKVAEEIKSAKIPVFGENFAPETCEALYKSVMEEGYQIGLGPYSVMFKVPGKLTDGQKRMWILAKTSADLSCTSERFDHAFRDAYKDDYENLKNLYTGNSDIKSQAVAEALEVSGESEEKGDKEEYEDPEAAKVAAELEQAELNKEILGFDDVLVMIKYCNEAAEHATQAFPQVEASLEKAKIEGKLNDTVSLSGSEEATPEKVEGGDVIPEKKEPILVTLTPTPPKATSTPVGSEEKEKEAVIVKPTEAEVINLTSSEENTPEKPISPVKPSPTKPVEPIVNQDVIEIDVSPDKSVLKAKETSGIEEAKNGAKENCEPELPKCSGDNGKAPAGIVQPLTGVASVNTVGTGQEAKGFDFESGMEAALRGPGREPVVTVKEPLKKVEPVKGSPVVIEINSSPESDKEENGMEKKKKEEEAVAYFPVQEKSSTEVDTPTNTPQGKASGVEGSTGEDLNKTGSSENSDIVEIFPENDKEEKKEEVVVVKEKGNKKKEGVGRSTRTSSRLASPEPDLLDKQNEEVKGTGASGKKTGTRQQLSMESLPYAPALRSRRGATPTKGGGVEVVLMENLPGVVELKISTVKPSTPVQGGGKEEDTEEETFETPRSTPESTEMGKDVEAQVKPPPKPVKVYSVKPPSPLSQVDPRLLDEFIDEDEDAELVEIDSNVNKAKGLKGAGAGMTPNKSLALRGRTVSSENAEEGTGGGGQANEDSVPSKRVTRKFGLNEDAEDDGASNNDEGESKRLTRSSLKLHDAANDESTEAPQTESEKAASESSFGGKEKKPRTSKQLLRVKKLHDEKTRFYGEDTEESPDGKRLTRAQRARTSTSSTNVPEKRSKPPSVGDSEGLSESEPTPTRATRSRSSTTANTPAPVEPAPAQPSSSSSQISAVSSVDEEEQKNLRKSLMSLYDKLIASDAAGLVLKCFQDDQALIANWNADLAQVKKIIEVGKGQVSNSSFQFELNVVAINAVMRMPNSGVLQEAAESFAKLVQTSLEEIKVKPGEAPLPKNDNSDVESLESHDEQRSETSSSMKQTPVGGGSGGGGGRRKRKRSTSETSEDVLPQENKRRVTRTSTSSSSAYNSPASRKTKHPISPDIVSANRVRH